MGKSKPRERDVVCELLEKAQSLYDGANPYQDWKDLRVVLDRLYGHGYVTKEERRKILEYMEELKRKKGRRWFIIPGSHLVAVSASVELAMKLLS